MEQMDQKESSEPRSPEAIAEVALKHVYGIYDQSNENFPAVKMDSLILDINNRARRVRNTNHEKLIEETVSVVVKRLANSVRRRLDLGQSEGTAILFALSEHHILNPSDIATLREKILYQLVRDEKAATEETLRNVEEMKKRAAKLMTPGFVDGAPPVSQREKFDAWQTGINKRRDHLLPEDD